MLGEIRKYGIMLKRMKPESNLIRRELTLSEDAAQIIQSAVYGKLADSAIRPEQLPALLPHLRKYGWPGESVSTIPVRVAFRLTEPEDDSDTEWLLETVIIGERGTHWTPAVRKRNSPVAGSTSCNDGSHMRMRLLKKQSEMISFLRSVEIESDESFLSVPMHDSEVRLFIQEDLPLLQSFGYPVILPAWLKSITESKMRVRTNASVQSYNSATGS